jgi:hypothetical protein
MAAELMELARLYAALNPIAASDTSTTTTPDFLDSLWRAQMPVNHEPKSLIDLRADIQKGITALTSLLDGVQDPLRAIRMVSDLVQAAINGEAWHREEVSPAILDARVIRELVELGFEFAQMNPTLNQTPSTTLMPGFLDALWRGDAQQVRQAESGLNAFFAGLATREQQLQGLDFAVNLLQAANLLQ